MKNKSNAFISAEVLIWGVVTITHESDGLQSISSQRQQISTGSTREQLQRSRICLLFPPVWTSHQRHSWKSAFHSLCDPDRVVVVVGGCLLDQGQMYIIEVLALKGEQDKKKNLIH